MLESARAKLREGVDVVVETHGRRGTAVLWEGFEVSPRKPVAFDIDAARKRHPALILVDELARTNIPGSSSATKMWISCWMPASTVYTTVNIQHLDPPHDVVAQITRVRVREIVPDAILGRADAIEFVDLTPDHLSQRLKEGKVCKPSTPASTISRRPI
jgi:two-component system, OmpR family, sensor histidine kinase KdpD